MCNHLLNYTIIIFNYCLINYWIKLVVIVSWSLNKSIAIKNKKMNVYQAGDNLNDFFLRRILKIYTRKIPSSFLRRKKIPNPPLPISQWFPIIDQSQFHCIFSLLYYYNRKSFYFFKKKKWLDFVQQKGELLLLLLLLML